MSCFAISMVVIVLFALVAGCGKNGNGGEDESFLPGLNLNAAGEPAMEGQAASLDPAHFARVSLDYEGVYEGIVPAAKGPGIHTRLVLRPESRYELLQVHPDRDTKASEFKGSFSWLEDGGTIRLEGLRGESRPDLFFVAENRLFQLDKQGRRFEGSLAGAYVLEKKPPLIIPWPLFEHRWELREKEGQPVDSDAPE